MIAAQSPLAREPPIAPPTAPATNPSGPVMKMPSSGPWLAPGMKMIGPKKPAENPMPPVTSAPTSTALTKPGCVVDVRRHTERAASTPAASEAANDIHGETPREKARAPPAQYVK